MNLPDYYRTVSGTRSCLQTCYLCSNAVGLHLLVLRTWKFRASAWLIETLGPQLALRSLSWLHSDITMPILLLHDVLILHSAVINFNTVLLHSCYHFVITLLPFFPLYLTLFPQANGALFFIVQFEIYLWQEGHRHVSVLLAVEQYSHNWFQIWKFV